MAGKLVEQDLHPHGHPQQPLGDQLGCRRSGEGSRAERTGARPLITSPPDAAAIGADLDLDLLGILGVAGGERHPTPGTTALVLGQLAEVLDDWQVTVVPPLRPGPLRSLAATGGLGEAGSSSPSRPLERSRDEACSLFGPKSWSWSLRLSPRSCATSCSNSAIRCLAVAC